VTTFADHARAAGATSLATFGDSITWGMSATVPERRWANLLAARLGVVLRNKGISATVMQNSPMADGRPGPNNGLSRYERDLLGYDRADLVAILYGFNDARYMAAPGTFHRSNFVRDYRAVLAGLLGAGFAPEAICLGSQSHIPDAGLGVGNGGFAGQSRRAFEAYVGTVRALAKGAGTFYAAVNERMQTQGGDALIAEDHVHPNDAGHAVIAAAFADAERPAG
jgi:lysophospholipase L1-like esterase